MKKILFLLLLPVLVYGQNISLDKAQVDTLRPRFDSQLYMPRKTKIDSLNVGY